MAKLGGTALGRLAPESAEARVREEEGGGGAFKHSRSQEEGWGSCQVALGVRGDGPGHPAV